MNYKHLSLSLLMVASAHAASTDPMDYLASRNICGNGQYESFCTELRHMYEASKTAGMKTKEELRAIQQTGNSLGSRSEVTSRVMNTILDNLNAITQRPDLDPQIGLIIVHHNQDLIDAWEQYFSIFLSYASNTETERVLMVSAFMQYTYLMAMQQLQNL